MYDELRKRILAGTYGPGFRLVIDGIASELGVSAVPAREAIRRLEAEGLVIFEPQVGARVSPVDPGQFTEELSVLAVLEGYATVLAAPLVRAQDLRRLLREINARMVDCLDRMDSLTFGALNREFHAAIYARCPSPYLVELIEATTARLDRIRRTVFLQIPYRGKASIAEHDGLIDLMSTGAGPAAIETGPRTQAPHRAEFHRVAGTPFIAAARRSAASDPSAMASPATRQRGADEVDRAYARTCDDGAAEPAGEGRRQLVAGRVDRQRERRCAGGRGQHPGLGAGDDRESQQADDERQRDRGHRESAQQPEKSEGQGQDGQQASQRRHQRLVGQPAAEEVARPPRRRRTPAAEPASRPD
ncbi:FCD domain-containing protein [Fodinicola feengrottensis]|uniref:FCD domain-containing protein n=1 Tax=Fodinicola feengrottensis TaxID=435914 RepID=UPI0036F2BA09